MEEQKKKQRKPIKISKETMILIAIIVIVFVAWNLMLPHLFKVSEVKNISLPQVKRGNVQFIDEQIQARTLSVPTLQPQETNLGKQNPFE